MKQRSRRSRKRRVGTRAPGAEQCADGTDRVARIPPRADIRAFQGSRETATMVPPNYLFFTTTCEQAPAFYERCGPGRVTEMRCYDVDDMLAPTDALRGKITHARFEEAGVLFPCVRHPRRRSASNSDGITSTS